MSDIDVLFKKLEEALGKLLDSPINSPEDVALQNLTQETSPNDKRKIILGTSPQDISIITYKKKNEIQKLKAAILGEQNLHFFGDVLSEAMTQKQTEIDNSAEEKIMIYFRTLLAKIIDEGQKEVKGDKEKQELAEYLKLEVEKMENLQDIIPMLYHAERTFSHAKNIGPRNLTNAVLPTFRKEIKPLFDVFRDEIDTIEQYKDELIPQEDIIYDKQSNKNTSERKFLTYVELKEMKEKRETFSSSKNNIKSSESSEQRNTLMANVENKKKEAQEKLNKIIEACSENFAKLKPEISMDSGSISTNQVDLFLKAEEICKQGIAKLKELGLTSSSELDKAFTETKTRIEAQFDTLNKKLKGIESVPINFEDCKSIPEIGQKATKLTEEVAKFQDDKLAFAKPVLDTAINEKNDAIKAAAKEKIEVKKQEGELVIKGCIQKLSGLRAPLIATRAEISNSREVLLKQAAEIRQQGIAELKELGLASSSELEKAFTETKTRIDAQFDTLNKKLKGIESVPIDFSDCKSIPDINQRTANLQAEVAKFKDDPLLAFAKPVLDTAIQEKNDAITSSAAEKKIELIKQQGQLVIKECIQKLNDLPTPPIATEVEISKARNDLLKQAEKIVNDENDKLVRLGLTSSSELAEALENIKKRIDAQFNTLSEKLKIIKAVPIDFSDCTSILKIEEKTTNLKKEVAKFKDDKLAFAGPVLNTAIQEKNDAITSSAADKKIELIKQKGQLVINECISKLNGLPTQPIATEVEISKAKDVLLTQAEEIHNKGIAELKELGLESSLGPKLAEALENTKSRIETLFNTLNEKLKGIKAVPIDFSDCTSIPEIDQKTKNLKAKVANFQDAQLNFAKPVLNTAIKEKNDAITSSAEEQKLNYLKGKLKGILDKGKEATSDSEKKKVAEYLQGQVSRVKELKDLPAILYNAERAFSHVRNPLLSRNMGNNTTSYRTIKDDFTAFRAEINKYIEPEELIKSQNIIKDIPKPTGFKTYNQSLKETEVQYKKELGCLKEAVNKIDSKPAGVDQYNASFDQLKKLDDYETNRLTESSNSMLLIEFRCLVQEKRKNLQTNCYKNLCDEVRKAIKPHLEFKAGVEVQQHTRATDEVKKLKETIKEKGRNLSPTQRDELDKLVTSKEKEIEKNFTAAKAKTINKEKEHLEQPRFQVKR